MVKKFNYCPRKDCVNFINKLPYCRFLKQIYHETKTKGDETKEVKQRIDFNPYNCMFYKNKEKTNERD